ncbi:hypothetical protein SNA07_02960, partial [Escherichia coli]|nr:hypothetical protein [Escherichia coli]
MFMKNCLLLGALLMGFTGVAMAQSVTVDVPSGYKVLMNPLMILVKIIKLRWIHILSYDQMVS